MYSKLFESTTLGNMVLKNRFVMAPMSTCDNLGFRMSEQMIRFYEERAKGGVALIMPECQAVCKIDSMTSLYRTAGTKKQEEDWKKFNDRMKVYDVKTCCQLGCGCGRNSSVIPGGYAVSSSELPMFANPKKKTRAMTIDQIHIVIKAFGKSAVMAKRAGFDAVEIHAHMGYLLDQFISKCWNKRTDQYGGSVENRVRICVEIIEEIRRNVGEGYPILFRMSMDHKLPNERGLKESLEIVKELDKTSLDAFDVDLGSYDSDSWGVTPEYYGDACTLSAAEAIKTVTNKPILNAGSFTPDTANEAVEKEIVDYVMLGRGLIADADFVNKIKQERTAEIRPCIRCNNYCIYHFFQLLPISCAVNPQAASEDLYTIQKTSLPQNVVVIGGGPGGMEAACVAAMEGHKVFLYEKTDKLGGQLIAASEPPFKKQLNKLIQYLEYQMKLLNVEVVLEKEIKEDSPELKQADKIIIALGASPIMPRLPGIQNKNVIEVIEAHTKRRKEIGETVVILGGGLSGCDFALELAKEGKQVTIVEMMDQVAGKCNWMNRAALLAQLKQYNVNILCRHKALEFSNEGVIVENVEGQKVVLEADTAIVALGTKSNKSESLAIQTKYPQAVTIGDCAAVGQVGKAIHEAFEAAWLFESGSSENLNILKKRKKEEKFKKKISSIVMPKN